MTDAERLEDCGECGQRVGVVERHTFVDCSLYAANHRGSLALPGKYAKALVAEVERLRGRILQWAADRCDDPLDHSQEYRADGLAMGVCGKCEMCWPCPSFDLALAADAELGPCDVCATKERTYRAALADPEGKG